MNLSVQFMTMAAMAVMGIWVGVSVDTYGRFFYRGGRRRWNPVQITGDLLFWTIQGLLVFLVLLYVNEGDVRIYTFLSLLCGYAAYRSLFQTFYLSSLDSVIKSAVYLIRLVKKFITFVFIKPVQLLLKFVYTISKLFISVLLSALVLIWSILYVPAKWLFGLLLPDVFLSGMKKNLMKAAGFRTMLKNIKDKAKSWFFDSDK